MLIQKATTSQSLQYCSTQCQFFRIFNTWFKNGCLLHQIILPFGYEEFIGQWENSIIYIVSCWFQKLQHLSCYSTAVHNVSFFEFSTMILKEILKTYEFCPNACRIKPNNFINFYLEGSSGASFFLVKTSVQ